MNYKGFAVKRTKSSFGSWVVFIRSDYYEFFDSKKDAVRFIDRHLSDLKTGNRL